MKRFLTTCLAVLPAFAYAQLTPGPTGFDKRWLKPETYRMDWYMQRDTAQVQIGAVTTQLVPGASQLAVITSVSMRGMNSPWADTSVCDIATLSPIRHSSYNGQRDMVLLFGNVVTGFYNDKRKQQNTTIRDTTHSAYFDSNLYPTLIRWLPLRAGYTQKIAIYDYNPAAKIGVIGASVEGVDEGTYASRKSGPKPVWVVRVTDEISAGQSVYYIDKSDRTLWQQTIESGGRKMVMKRVE